MTKSETEARDKQILVWAEEGVQQVIISRRFDPPISRERVRQILERQGFKKKRWLHFCATPGCKGTKTYPYRLKSPIHCAKCVSYRVRHHKFPPKEWFILPRVKPVKICKCGKRSDQSKWWKKDMCANCGMKEYRLTHPEYVERTRLQQKVRNKGEYQKEYCKRSYVIKMLS